MENRIHYSKDQMLLHLESSLRELNAFRYDGRFQAILGDAFLKKMSAWEQSILSRKDDAFTVVVVGDFKRGKSTLINALLGEEIVTSDVTTETVTLNRLSYGTHSNEVILSGSRRAVLTDEELKRESLEKVLEQLGERADRLELKRPCEMLKKITFIDTPGTGDAMRDFSEMVQECLLQADAVIYVYNVQYPLSRTEQLFLKSAVIPQKFTSLFLVGNCCDILKTQKDYDNVRAFLEERIQSLLPGTTTYMVSALNELCQQLGEEYCPNPVSPILDEQFRMLREDLIQLVEDKSDTVLLSRMQRLTCAMVEDLSAELNAIEKGLSMSSTEAEEALKAAQQRQQNSARQREEVLAQLAQTVDSMQAEASAWMADFMQRMSAEIRGLRTENAETLKKYFELYCIDLVQEAMDKCLDFHEDRLYDYLDGISETLSAQIDSVLPQKREYAFRIHLDNRIWTKGDTVGLFASYAGNFGVLGRIASLTADGISGTMRNKEAEARVPELVEQISRKMLDLNADISQTIQRQYAQMGESAKKLLTEYSLSEDEKERSLLEQTVLTAQKNEKEKQQLQQMIESARRILARITVE